MIRTVFFGGTFDPPHCGHLMLARFVLKQKIADELWLAPAWIPPHKAAKKISSFEDRVAMTRLAAEGIAGVSVTGIEGKRKGVSYTIDTLDMLSAQNPEREMILLIGGDSLATLHLWHEAEELARRYKIITWPRPGSMIRLEDLLKHWSPALAAKLHAGIIPDVPLTTVTSTEIRESIAKKGHSPFVKTSVMEYITRRRLYQ